MRRLELERLREIHPQLPETTAAELVFRAALALQRRHLAGVNMGIRLVTMGLHTSLDWTFRAPAGDAMLDRHRVTEDGAEVLALLLVNVAFGWVARRRLQRGECADWLLRDADDRRIALEISGTDNSDVEVRLREKVAQVSKSKAAGTGGTKAACVVRFEEPLALLATA